MAFANGTTIPFHLQTETVTNTTYNVLSTLGLIFAAPTAAATYTLPALDETFMVGAVLKIINASAFNITLVTQGGDSFTGPKAVPAGMTGEFTVNETYGWATVSVAATSAVVGLGHPLHGQWIQRTSGLNQINSVNSPMMFIDTTVYPYVYTTYSGAPMQYANHGKMSSLIRTRIPTMEATGITGSIYAIDSTNFMLQITNLLFPLTSLTLQSNGDLVVSNTNGKSVSVTMSYFTKSVTTIVPRPYVQTQAMYYENCNNAQFMLEEHLEILLTQQNTSSYGLNCSRFPGEAALRERFRLLTTVGIEHDEVTVLAVQTTNMTTSTIVTNSPLTTIICQQRPNVVPGAQVVLAGFADALLNGTFTVGISQLSHYDADADYCANTTFTFTILLDSAALAADADGYYTGIVGGETAQATIAPVLPDSEAGVVFAAMFDLDKYAVQFSQTFNTTVSYIPAQSVVVISAPGPAVNTYAAVTGSNTPLPTTTGVTGDIVVCNPFLADTALVNAAAVSGKIAFCGRGTVSFNVKMTNCLAAGAIGMIVANTDDIPFAMNITGSIPAVIISLTNATILLANTVGLAGTIKTKSDISNQLPAQSWSTLQTAVSSVLDEFIDIRAGTYNPCASWLYSGQNGTFILPTLRNSIYMANDRYMKPISTYLGYDIIYNNYLDLTVGFKPSTVWWNLTGAAETLEQSAVGLFFFNNSAVGREFNTIMWPHDSSPGSAYYQLGGFRTTNVVTIGRRYMAGRINPSYTGGENIAYLSLFGSINIDNLGIMATTICQPVVSMASTRPGLETMLKVFSTAIRYMTTTLGCTHVIIDTLNNFISTSTYMGPTAALANLFGGSRQGYSVYTSACEIGGGTPVKTSTFTSMGSGLANMETCISAINPALVNTYYGAGSTFANCRVSIIADVNTVQGIAMFIRQLRGDALDGDIGNGVTTRIYGDIDGRVDGGYNTTGFYGTAIHPGYKVTAFGAVGPQSVHRITYDSGHLTFKLGAEPVFTCNRGTWLKPESGPNLGAGPWSNRWDDIGWPSIGAGLSAGTLPARLAGDARPNPTYPPASTAERANWRAPWHEEVIKIVVALP